jgi:hypothetical protein
MQEKQQQKKDSALKPKRSHLFFKKKSHYKQTQQPTKIHGVNSHKLQSCYLSFTLPAYHSPRE